MRTFLSTLSAGRTSPRRPSRPVSSGGTGRSSPSPPSSELHTGRPLMPWTTPWTQLLRHASKARRLDFPVAPSSTHHHTDVATRLCLKALGERTPTEHCDVTVSAGVSLGGHERQRRRNCTPTMAPVPSSGHLHRLGPSRVGGALAGKTRRWRWSLAMGG